MRHSDTEIIHEILGTFLCFSFKYLMAIKKIFYVEGPGVLILYSDCPLISVFRKSFRLFWPVFLS